MESNSSKKEDIVFPKFGDLNKIEDYLYLGDIESATFLSTLKTYDIRTVLSVIDEEIPHYQLYDNITYHSVDAKDFRFQDLLTYFPETNQFISNSQKNGRNILVHCMAGISRSATVVIAYIMHKYKIPYTEAKELVLSKRAIWPNVGFVEQLKLYEEMEFTLNPNNRKFRQYLVEIVLHERTKCFRFLNNIKKFFERLELAESLVPSLESPGEAYHCSNCGFFLFNEIHVIRNENSKNSKNLCGFVYIEPQKWMKETFVDFSVMKEFNSKCPQCKEVILEFYVHFKEYLCECNEHKGLGCLRFRVPINKIKTQEK